MRSYESASVTIFFNSIIRFIFQPTSGTVTFQLAIKHVLASGGFKSIIARCLTPAIQWNQS